MQCSATDHNKTMNKHLINQLQLVYPPISNQSAEWLWDDKVVREYVKRSKIYMLAQKQEVLFDDYSIDTEEFTFEFSLKIGDQKQPNLAIRCNDLVDCYDKNIEFEIGPQIFKIWDRDKPPSEEPIFWATTEKLLYDLWRGHYPIKGDIDLRKLTKYNIYYVGISNKQDSFSRLFKNGHKNRTKILSNERQITPTGRLTDEIYIFLFDIKEIQLITSLSFEEPVPTPKEWLIADAEKAFVNFLKSKYNDIQFKKYPEGADGLYGKGFDTYSYMIDEDIEFYNDQARFVGVHNYYAHFSGSPSFILTRGDQAELINGEELQI